MADFKTCVKLTADLDLMFERHNFTTVDTLGFLEAYKYLCLSKLACPLTPLEDLVHEHRA